MHPIVKKEEEQLELIAPIPHPPPYASLFPETVDETDHLIGSVRESDVIVVRVDQEHCSRAIPIGYDDDFNFQRQEESESEADEPDPIAEVSDRESHLSGTAGWFRRQPELFTGARGLPGAGGTGLCGV